MSRPRAQSEQNARQLFTRGEARLALFGGAFKNRFGVGYTNYHTTIQAPDTGFGLPPENINHGDRLKFDWQGNIELGKGHDLILGVEDQTDRLIDSPISAENGNTPASPSCSRRSSAESVRRREWAL